MLTGRWIQAVILPFEGTADEVIVLAKDMGDDLRADVLAFALSIVAMIDDGSVDPAPYADPDTHAITVRREYLPLSAGGLDHQAVKIAWAVGIAGRPPIFEVLPAVPTDT